MLNRIIIIGNGFDLAQNLPTSYNNFIDWLIVEKHKKLEEVYYRYEDDDITYSPGYYSHRIPLEEVKKKFIYSEVKSTMPIYVGGSSTYQRENTFDIGQLLYKNKFLEIIIRSRYINGWADIEGLFYQELNKIVSNPKSTDKEIKKFNTEFYRIISLLEEYLSSVVDENIDPNFKERVNSILNAQMDLDDLSIEFNNKNEIDLIRYSTDENGVEQMDILELEYQTFIIDFNYTQTIKKYYDLTDSNYINIHGVLNDEKNPIIFGFGDELDQEYTTIENSKLDGVFEFIKSINYLKTDNYRKVLNLLEWTEYQVIILGHSCGLTDRTLLNHIFEHPNCVSIKPYYYQWKDKEEIKDDYIKLVSNITRNFKDKNKFRDRVVNYTFCEPLIPVE